MFIHDDTCHVLMPRHVAGFFPKTTITTPDPVKSATATMVSPFWDGIDLSLGVIRGLDDRCTSRLEDLEETPGTMNAGTAELLRLTPSGDIDRSPLQIMDRNYLTFDATLEGNDRGIAQGTSGAFAFVRGRPIGMAYKYDPETGQATFIRSGEVLIHVRRFLEQQGGAFVPAANEVGSTLQATEAGALPLVFYESTVTPVNPMFAPENMTGPGMFVFAPARQMRFVFGFEAHETRAVSRIVLRSAPGQGQTMPKNLILRWSVSDTPENYKTWIRGSVASDGIFETGPLGARNVRWIEIIALDTWGGGDVVIDEVTAY